MPGYGRRYAARFGEFVVQNSFVAAGNAALGYEPRYDFCRCRGFWPRTEHAVSRSFMAYNRTEPELRPTAAYEIDGCADKRLAAIGSALSGKSAQVLEQCETHEAHAGNTWGASKTLRTP